jgi:hypothetical protein
MEKSVTNNDSTTDGDKTNNDSTTDGDKTYYEQAKEYYNQGVSYIYENKGTFSWVLLLSICILIIFILIGIFGQNNKNNSDITRKNIIATGNCTIDGTLTIAGDAIIYEKVCIGDNDKTNYLYSGDTYIHYVAPYGGHNFYWGTTNSSSAVHGSNLVFGIGGDANAPKTFCNLTFECSGDINCSRNIFATLVYASNVQLTSDYRLKENIMPIPDYYSIDNLNPCVYNLKDSPEKLQTGFIAHELQEVFPHLVNGEKDGEDMQSVNYIQLIAILTKEIQDLKKRVLQLESTSF